MINKIILNGKEIKYDLEYKNVKNINLRIKADGKIYVSANRLVPFKVIETFILKNTEYILNALSKYENINNMQHFTEEELRKTIINLCNRAYDYFAGKGIGYPVIKFKRMTSRWGSCNPVKGTITFNTTLMYAPYECVEYVVFHEFTHFLQPNHSKDFYAELEKICPKWKVCRNMLKEIKTV